MQIEPLNCGGTVLAVVSGGENTLVDAQSVLDLVMTVRQETHADRIVLDKTLFCREFFILSTGLAGEILQKLTNYHVKAAIYGDYSGYTSKPLLDFIRESNRGRDFFFVSTKEEAIQRLSA